MEATQINVYMNKKEKETMENRKIILLNTIHIISRELKVDLKTINNLIPPLDQYIVKRLKAPQFILDNIIFNYVDFQILIGNRSCEKYIINLCISRIFEILCKFLLSKYNPRSNGADKEEEYLTEFNKITSVEDIVLDNGIKLEVGTSLVGEKDYIRIKYSKYKIATQNNSLFFIFKIDYNNFNNIEVGIIDLKDIKNFNNKYCKYSNNIYDFEHRSIGKKGFLIDKDYINFMDISTFIKINSVSSLDYIKEFCQKNLTA